MAHDLPDGVRRVLFPVRRPGALVICWFWRYEGLGALAVILGALHLDRTLGFGATLSALFAVGAVLLLSRTMRRWTHGRLRAIWVQHRLRVGFVEAGLFATTGRIPWLLWTRPQGSGERSYALLPAGVTVARVAAGSPVLAGAAWADEVRVRPYEGRTHLIVIDVLRTDRSAP